ncbi:unnamed protein product [Auanema sp. JU1783]|nr:unnamed protein product [Auanema sp. JU1783]
MSDNGDRNSKRNEDELETRQLNFGYKRYYVDVKENNRGRFIKIAEMGTHYKSRVVLSMAAAVQLRDQLGEMIKFSNSIPEGEDPVTEPSTLKSETLLFDTRRYYLDLKVNQRGRFLRIAQTINNPRSGRSQVAIPAANMTEIRDTISELIDKYSAGFLQDTPNPDLPKAKQVQSENNKTFYFDVGQNEKGTYVRISEVKLTTGYRSSITVPMSAMDKFKEVMEDVIKEVSSEKESSA